MTDCGGVLHCFTEDRETAGKLLDLGFYISFSGIVTFRNAEQLRDAARYVPLDRILVETDSPYLAPVPHRGKENQPAMTRDVAEYMAVLKGVSIEELARVTTQNFLRCSISTPPACNPSDKPVFRLVIINKTSKVHRLIWGGDGVLRNIQTCFCKLLKVFRPS